MRIFLLVGAMIIIAIAAIVAAIVIVVKNTSQRKKLPVLTVNAKVIKTYSQSYESYTVDSANTRTTSTYFIDLLLEDNSKKTFKINKKLYLNTNDGDNGVLTFQGNKLIGLEMNK